MKEKTLHEKAREKLNYGVIPEIFKLMKELKKDNIQLHSSSKIFSFNYINLSSDGLLNFYSIHPDFLVTVVCPSNSFHHLDFDKIEIDNHDLLNICTIFKNTLKSLEKEKKEFIKFIDTPISINRKLLTEKTQK